MSDWAKNGELPGWTSQLLRRVHEYYTKNEEQIWTKAGQFASLLQTMAPMLLASRPSAEEVEASCNDTVVTQYKCDSMGHANNAV